MGEFKVGDKAQYNGVEVTVRFGPVAGFLGAQKYVVEQENGDHRWVTPRELTAPVREFRAGDRVKWCGEEMTLKAGPFDSRYGGTFWVAENKNGKHNTLDGEDITLISRGSIVTVEGVQYDLSKKYRDAEGDTWLVADVGGVTRARCGGTPTGFSPALTDVVSHWGPLTET